MHTGLGHIDVKRVHGDVGVAFNHHGTGPILHAEFGVGDAAIEKFSGGDVLSVDVGGGTKSNANSYPEDEHTPDEGEESVV